MDLLLSKMDKLDKLVNYSNAAIAALSKIVAKDQKLNISELTAENTTLKESVNVMILHRTRCLRVCLIWKRKNVKLGSCCRMLQIDEATVR